MLTVWAPRAASVVAGGRWRRTVPMAADGDGWWSTPGPRSAATSTTGSGSTTPSVLPDPRSRRQPDGVHGPSRTFDPGVPPVERRVLDRPAARRRRDLRTAHRHLHPGGHARRGDRRARPPGRPRRRLRGAVAGQRLQRHPQLGLRRRAVVRRARDLRRPGRLPAVRRRLPRPRPRRHPGRRLQPPRPQRQLPAAVRPVPARRATPTPGAPRSTWTAPTPTRCAATSSTTP